MKITAGTGLTFFSDCQPAACRRRPRGLVWLFLFFLLPLPSPPVHAQPSLEPYYAFLEQLALLPHSQRIARLGAYLAQPNIPDRAFLKFVEVCLLTGQPDSGRAVLRAIDDSKAAKYWALAVLAERRRDLEGAAQAYAEALRLGLRTPAFLFDVFNFRQKNPMQGRLPIPESASVSPLIAMYEHFFNGRYRQAMAAGAVLSRQPGASPFLMYLCGLCAYETHAFDQADSLWQRGIDRARGENDLEAEARLLTSLGVLATEVRGDTARAARLFDQAEKLARRIDDTDRLQLVLGNRAKTQPNDQASLRDFRQAAALARKLGRLDDAARWSMGAAQAAFAQNQFGEALQLNEQALQLARLSADGDLQLAILRDRGDYYFDLHLDSLAYATYEQVYRQAQRSGRLDQALSAQARMADAWLEAGAFERARQAYWSYVDWLPRDNQHYIRAYWLGRIAAAFVAEGRLEKAREVYLRAADLAAAGSTSDDALYRHWLLLEGAKLDLRRGVLRQALQIATETADFGRQIGDNQLEWQSLAVLADAEQQLGQLQSAIAHLQRAVKLVETTRKQLTIDQLRVSYFSEAQRVYRQLAKTFLQKWQRSGDATDLDSLFFCLQHTRGRAMHELSFTMERRSAGASVQPDSLTLKAHRELSRLQRRFRAFPESYAAAQTAHQAARYTLLVHRLRQQADLPETPEPTLPSIAKMQRWLQKQRSALLLYALEPDTAYVFVLTPSESHIAGLRVKPETLQQQVQHLLSPFISVRRLTADRVNTIAFHSRTAHDLYTQLFAPIEPLLRRQALETVVIIPDEPIMGLPFELLMMARPARDVYTPVDPPDYAPYFLLHRYAFAYSPSVAALRARHDRRSAPGRLVIFANPFRPDSGPLPASSSLRLRRGWRFAPLPYAEFEAEQICAMHPQCRIYKRESATTQRYFEEAPAAEILHFATHAFADIGFDAFAGLVLAPEPDSLDDGFLMGYEIAGHPTATDLVVLGACETGRGRPVSGEGVLGLPRLFLGAGAQSVLMTQWPIDDRIAAQLLPKFYEAYLDRGASKAAALAQAKRRLIETGSGAGGLSAQHPFYWAAYMLYGSPSARSHAGSAGWLGVLILAVALALLLTLWYRRRRS